MSPLNLYRIEKERIRENLNKYTQKAFNLIQEIKNPLILDVGCGTGVPTIQLAKISGGKIIGVDNDETSLSLLKKKIQDLGLDGQVQVINDSIFNMEFPEESFDIIWAEGSVFVMGFENSIKTWYPFLKPGGFIVIHDDSKDEDEKLEIIKNYGYNCISEFELSHQVWWEEYYAPLEELVKKFKNKYPDDLELITELNKDQVEIDENFSAVMASSFVLIIQKI
jgi:ubiquinone/menaquinone biosynthesis C-methylase UbiE